MEGYGVVVLRLERRQTARLDDVGSWWCTKCSQDFAGCDNPIAYEGVKLLFRRAP